MSKILTTVLVTAMSLMVSACAMHGTWAVSAVKG